MQQKYEFIQYTPTPGEKHLGIAEVRVYGAITIVLRYKIIAKRDGTGCFPACSSYKMPNRMPGEEYESCFVIDSRSENEAIVRCVMHGYNDWLKSQKPPETSVFAISANQQPYTPSSPQSTHNTQLQHPQAHPQTQYQYQPQTQPKFFDQMQQPPAFSIEKPPF
jgi:hypothetical protein